MRENEFEKKVNQTLESFRVPPSPTVWEDVERRIRERKKRRLIFFWFLLAGILLAGIWALIYLPDNIRNSHQLTTTDTVVVRIDTTKKAGEASTPSQHSIVNSNDESTVADIKSAGQSSVTGDKKTIADATFQGSVSDKHKASSAIAPAVQTDKGKNNIVISAGNGAKQKRKNPKRPADQSRQTVADPLPDLQNGNTVSPERVDVSVKADKSNLPDTSAIAINPVALKKQITDSNSSNNKAVEPVASAPQKKQHKWQTGIIAGFGQSRLIEGGLHLFAEKAADAMYTGGGTGVSTGVSNSSLADSIPLKGPALLLGVYAKKSIGKKTSFSAGMQAGYYAGKQRVGVYVDSVRDAGTAFSNRQTNYGFYRLGSTGQFMNRYYYLQLPLLIHWQINKGDQIPLTVETGLVPSLLVYSRAVVYNPTHTFFFRDRHVYNTFSLASQSAFSVTLFADRKRPLTASVFYTYHFSGLQKEGSPRFNHLSSYGLLLRIPLNK